MKKTYIIIHHTASNRDKTTLANVNAWHKVRWPDFKSSLGFWVGYHYLITVDGKINQTRKDIEAGAHCLVDNMNFRGIGVCLVGNFEIEKPTKAQCDSLIILLEQLKKENNILNTNIICHCKVIGAKTVCPGKNLIQWLNLNL